MGAQRPLIVPWLLEQLDAQQFPGVSWLNPERTRFRIPWKHGSRQSTIPEDFQLFEAWAIASGRYVPGTHPRTPSEWKRNFRAALNRKPGISVVADNSTDSEDPHKEFEIQHSVVLNDRAQIMADHVQGSLALVRGDSAPCCQDDSLEDVLKGLDLSGSEQENPVYNVGPSPSGLDPDLQTVLMRPLEPALGANEFVDSAASCAGLPPSGFEQAQPTAPMPLLDQITQTTAFGTEFEVRIYYRGQLVFHNTFSNVQGLCFVPPGSSVTYPDLATVILPDTSNMNDRLQAAYTNRLLRGVGALLHVEGLSLCGSRRGSCHVFWSQSETPTAGTRCGGLPKEQFSSLFSQQQFVQELIGFLEGRNGSPDYTLWLCFGEEWPDPSRVWKKKLIMIQVIPKAFEILHELCKAYGASSLNGAEPDLRISDSLQDCPLLEQLKSWGERMDVEHNS